MSLSILAPLDAANLQNFGLLGPGNTTASHRLHKRRLNRSSDEEHRGIPLSIPLSSPEAVDAFVTIPAVLISLETLIHVGLSNAKATELWNSWIDWPATGPRRETDNDGWGLEVTFLDFVTGSLENKVDAAGENDLEWRACLDACGIDTVSQDAIMDTHFRYLRLSNSCLYWAKDTIEMRYAGLEDIQRSSRMREKEIQQVASYPIGSQGGQGSGYQGNISLTSTSSTSQGQRSVSGLQQQGTAGIEVDIWGSSSSIAARNAPGYTVLFKVLDQARTAGLFNKKGALARTETLESSPPSDFSGNSSLFYFSPDYKVAQYYAAYAKRRTRCESVVIVCLHISNAAIESLSAPHIQRLFWPSNEWKELIWRCRTNQSLPSHLRKYREATLTIGTTSRRPDRVYYAMRTWEEVTEANLLCVGDAGQRIAAGQGNPAVQYVFSGKEEGREFLVEHAQDVKVFPYPATALEAWLADPMW